jgi:hypothetical protein
MSLPAGPTIANVFEHADKRLEFREQNLAQAVQALRLLTAQPVTRAQALLCIGRLERRLNHPAAALAAYDRISRETAVNPRGSGIHTVAGGGARCDLLAGQHGAVNAAAQLRRELIAGRWPLHLSAVNCATASAPSEMFKTLLLEDRMT